MKKLNIKPQLPQLPIEFLKWLRDIIKPIYHNVQYISFDFYPVIYVDHGYEISLPGYSTLPFNYEYTSEEHYKFTLDEIGLTFEFMQGE